MNIAIRADASLQIGSGHVMRGLTLAEAPRDRGAECRFICRELYDNALAETIHGLYQAEVIHRKSWPGLETVEWATLTWVDGFNHRRLLEPMGYIPPAEAEAADDRRLTESAMAA